MQWTLGLPSTSMTGRPSQHSPLSSLEYNAITPATRAECCWRSRFMYLGQVSKNMYRNTMALRQSHRKSFLPLSSTGRKWFPLRSIGAQRGIQVTSPARSFTIALSIIIHSQRSSTSCPDHYVDVPMPDLQPVQHKQVSKKAMLTWTKTESIRSRSQQPG